MQVLKLGNGVYELQGWTLPPLKKEDAAADSASRAAGTSAEAPRPGSGQADTKVTGSGSA